MASMEVLAGARARPALEAAASALTATVIVVSFALSSLMLARLGVAYEEAGGPGWQKIHPATPLALLAVLALALARGNPVAFVDDILKRQPGVIAFATMVLLTMCYAIWRVGGPVTQFIDTFILPLCLFILITRQSEAWLKRMTVFVHAFMALNATVGLGEFALGFRLTPLVAEGVEITTDWRSTALLGHPLLNAAATASYAFLLLAGGGRDLPLWLRSFALALQLAAMVPFGGRAATGLLFVFAIPAAIAAIWRHRGAYQMTPAAAGGVVLLAVLSVTVVGALAAGGFFDRFIGRFIDDGGSAAARSSMFDLIGMLTPEMLWFGSDPEYISSLQRQIGIPFGIESFWVAMVAFHGLLFSIPFFILFLVFMNEARRWAAPGAFWSIVLFLLIISTSTSLASKTAMLTIYLNVVCLVLRPARPHWR